MTSLITKAAGFAWEPCSLELANDCRSVFNHNALHGTIVTRTRVVDADFLAASKRCCHDSARTVNDMRGCAQSEADRSFIALHHNRLAGLISSYSTGSISRSRFRGRCRLCRRLFCGCRTRLCEREWRNQRASESDNGSLHYITSLFMLMVNNQIRNSVLERTLPKPVRTASGHGLLNKFLICVIERDR